MVWEVSTGFLLKTFKGHENWVLGIDINEAGTRMVSSSKGREIIYWDTNIKSDKNILNIFEEEHENMIDVVIFAPLKTAKTITKARMDQDTEVDEQTGGTTPAEETKQEEEENKGEKETNEGMTEIEKRSEELRKARERVAQLKKRTGRKTKEANEEEKKEESVDDIEVKDEFVASGSRDKRIKIWSAKKGT